MTGSKAHSLVISDLTKTYPNRKIAAISKASLRQSTGRVRAIVGPNGAGKTTLFRLVSGMLVPDTGTVAIEREDASLTSPVVSLLSESSFGFYPRLSVSENFKYLAGASAAKPKVISRGETLKCLDIVNLADRAKDECQKLSRGMLQRLNLAIALASSADVVLLDEPTNGLDILETMRFYELIRNLATNSSTLYMFSSHQPDTILGLADDVTFLVNGHIKTTIEANGLLGLKSEDFISLYLSIAATA